MQNLQLTFKPKITVAPSMLSPGSTTWVFHWPDGTTGQWGNRSTIAKKIAVDDYVKKLGSRFRHLVDAIDVTVEEPTAEVIAMVPADSDFDGRPAWKRMHDWLLANPGEHGLDEIAAAVGRAKVTIYQAAMAHSSRFYIANGVVCLRGSGEVIPAALTSEPPATPTTGIAGSEHSRIDGERSGSAVAAAEGPARQPEAKDEPEEPSVRPGKQPQQSDQVAERSAVWTKIVKLRSGVGIVTVRLDVDAFAMSPEDREFCFGIVDHLKVYEDVDVAGGTAAGVEL